MRALVTVNGCITSNKHRDSNPLPCNVLVFNTHVSLVPFPLECTTTAMMMTAITKTTTAAATAMPMMEPLAKPPPPPWSAGKESIGNRTVQKMHSKEVSVGTMCKVMYMFGVMFDILESVFF